MGELQGSLSDRLGRREHEVEHIVRGQCVVAGADVILTILLVGGAFALLDATGALARLVGALVGRTRRPRVVLVLVSLAFATLGALENMHEEIIALVPVLLVLSRGLGFGAITALAMSIGAAVVAAVEHVHPHAFVALDSEPVAWSAVGVPASPRP